MVGAILLVIALVVVIPVVVLMSGAFAAAAIGYVLKEGVEAQHEGSELVDLYV